MDFSLGGLPAARPAPREHRPRGSIDMTLGPAARGSANSAAQSDDDSDGGPDWRNALSRWVAEHAYYPEQAQRDGDEGDVRVHVFADHNGRVREVELIGKSGSMWLDLALQSMSVTRIFRRCRHPAASRSISTSPCTIF